MPRPTDALAAPFQGVSPKIGGAPAHAGRGAAVLGRATLGTGAWLGDFAVIRADGHFVEVGDDFHLGAHGTVHIAHDLHPTRIGHRVAAGEGAVIHACTVGDDVVLGAGAVILDGSVVGPGAVIAAGSVVFPRSEVAAGWLHSGSPAKPASRLAAGELEDHQRRIRSERPPEPRPASAQASALDCFVAPTAVVAGEIVAGEEVGIWYGCRLDAGRHRIVIGRGTNVQDNSIIACREADVVIGADVTIGHNVNLSDCQIDGGSLIGIGAVLAAGTVVEGDVLVAAGTRTEPGQTLTRGQVWAGRPARPIRPMNDRSRAMLAEIPPLYRGYARQFRGLEHRSLARLAATDAPGR